MDQWLKACTALPENLNSGSSIHIAQFTPAPITPAPEDPITSSGLCTCPYPNTYINLSGKHPKTVNKAFRRSQVNEI